MLHFSERSALFRRWSVHSHDQSRKASHRQFGHYVLFTYFVRRRPGPRRPRRDRPSPSREHSALSWSVVLFVRLDIPFFCSPPTCAGFFLAAGLAGDTGTPFFFFFKCKAPPLLCSLGAISFSLCSLISFPPTNVHRIIGVSVSLFVFFVAFNE